MASPGLVVYIGGRQEPPRPTLRKPTRVPDDGQLDMPPCNATWGVGCTTAGGRPVRHRCWTWAGWPHICRCLRCRGAG
jgi:hypothetical protein